MLNEIGYWLAFAKGESVARPRKNVNTAEIVKLRQEGLSWPSIAARMGLGLGTVHRAYRRALDAPQLFQNLSETILQNTPTDDPARKVQFEPMPGQNQTSRNIRGGGNQRRTAQAARNATSTRLTGLEGATFRNSS